MRKAAMHMGRYSVVLLGLVLCGIMPLAGNAAGLVTPDFRLYMIDSAKTPITMNALKAGVPDKLALAAWPLVTSNDVASVSKAAGGVSIELRSAVFKSFALLKPGTPFAICRGLKVLCLGVVWSDARGGSVDGVVALANYPSVTGNVIHIQAGYPAKKYFTGDDPTDDILESLGFTQ